MKKVVVIGSGFAGMSAASYLAKMGYKVTVVEKNEGPGGRARMWEKDGFLFDLGPSWYWMPEVFENFYNEFGFTTSNFYELKRLDPSYRVYFKEDKIDVPASSIELASLFESIEKGSGNKLTTFLANAKYKYNTALADYVHRPSHSIFEFMEPNLIAKAFKLKLFTPIQKEIAKVVSNKKLSSILEFPVLFLGSTPANTPSLYSMMNYADLELGTWYPMQGMHEISKAFHKVAVSQGVKFIFNTEVSKINVSNNSVASVKAGDMDIECDFVVGAGDYNHIEQELLDKENRTYSKEYWEKRTMSPSSLLFYVGVNKRIPNLLHHNLFFDANFEEHANEIYDNPKWPTEPLFYVCAPSVTDPSVAPEGKENLFFLMPIAPGLEDTDEMREKYFELIVNRIEQKTGVSFKNDIIVKRSYCVQDFKNDYHSFKGNAYGLANTLKQTAFLKPKLRSKKVKNLFFAGQLTVPGPGVPPSIMSGKIAALEINKTNKTF